MPSRKIVSQPEKKQNVVATTIKNGKVGKVGKQVTKITLTFDNIGDRETLEVPHFLSALGKRKADKKMTVGDKLSDASGIIHSEYEDSTFVNFLIQSDKSSEKRYNVSISNGKNGIKLECNCGDQFQLEKRNSCTHIGKCLSNLNEQYVLNSNKKLAKKQDRKIEPDELNFNLINL